jgi:hypothetical protein
VDSVSHFKPLCVALLLLASSACPVHAALVWHWDEVFSETEQNKIRAWLQETDAAVQSLVGPFPFDVHLHLRRRDGAAEPVPWANTDRRGRQALYFYVDPLFASSAFRQDWTAAHEFSHLVLPYLGRKNAWFAEGFASYLQYRVMTQMGVLTASEALARRDRKVRAAQAALGARSDSLPQAMAELREAGEYPVFYWGGSVYFERVEHALDREGKGLIDVLGEFLRCCRLQRTDLDGLVGRLDALSDSTVFTRELEIMRTTPGLPARPGEKKGPDGGP